MGNTVVSLGPRLDAISGIFISHKARDAKVAVEFSRILDANSSKFQFFLSENIEKGANWRSEISNALAGSSYLVLLFLDPEEDWGWCLYETGFFDALSQLTPQTQRRIFCIHNSATKPPDPIADLQTIRASRDQIEAWLRQLLREADEKDIHVENISKTAQEIHGLFQRPATNLYLARKLTVVAPDINLISEEDLGSEAYIAADRSLMEEIFQRVEDKLSWPSLEFWIDSNPNSKAANLKCFHEIARSVFRLSRKTVAQPLQSVLFVGEGPKRYRPVIHRTDESWSGALTCEILLVEDVGGQLQNIDKPLAALMAGIRMATRVRWEVLRPFDSRVRLLANANPHKLRSDLQTCLNNILTEANSRGVYTLEDIVAVYQDRELQDRMFATESAREMIFGKIWNAVGFEHVHSTFGEVSRDPFTDDALRNLEEAVRELKANNKEFLEMAVQRLETKIAEELNTDPT